MIPVGGSRWQEDFGIHDDTPERFFDDIMTKTKGSADPVVARALVDVGRELSEFLASACDIPLELLTDAEFPGHSRKRHLCVHDRAGTTLHRYLIEAAQSREAITMVVPLRVTALEPHEDGWIVQAVVPSAREK